MKTEILKNQDAICQHLAGLTNSELITLFNTYCLESGYMDDYIHQNNEEFFNESFSKSIDAVRAAHYGEYNYQHEFVKFNGYANLETTDSPSDWIDFNEVAAYILENPEAFDIELIEEEEA